MNSEAVVWASVGAVVGAVLALVIFDFLWLAPGAIIGGGLGWAAHGFKYGSRH
ncbi:hypothetical protein [Nocardioides sp. GXZ039]|uniref:hypothetical protein n=1 Tax=Nocardioides sp. GXZ039 TaxID=3136018 RepID=UPI0030F495B0